MIYSYEEFLFPVPLVAIGPSPTVLAFTSGAVVKNLIDRKSPIKMLFNVSQFTLAAGIGSGVAVLLGGVAVDAGEGGDVVFRRDANLTVFELELPAVRTEAPPRS